MVSGAGGTIFTTQPISIALKLIVLPNQIQLSSLNSYPAHTYIQLQRKAVVLESGIKQHYPAKCAV
jgi:hypothetical protein